MNWRERIPLIAVTALQFAGAPHVAVGADQAGIYFDQAGTINTLTVTDPTQWVTAWLIVKDLSSPLCLVQVDGRIEGQVLGYCWESLVGGCVFDCLLPWGTDRCGGGYPPLEPSANVLIIRMAFKVPSVESPVKFFLVDTGVPGYLNGYVGPGYEGFIPLSPTSGSYDMPVAVINGAVANETSSWGSVKSLYR